MKTYHESGSRKRAVARATLKSGTGQLKVNNVPIDNFEPKLARMKIREPLLIAGNMADKVDIGVDVFGQRFGGQGNNLISLAVTVDIVVRLEVVQIEIAHRDIARLFDRFTGMLT